MIWCFSNHMYIFEVGTSNILKMWSTCIYLKHVHPIYLCYGDFQSSCIYLKGVNILRCDVLC